MLPANRVLPFSSPYRVRLPRPVGDSDGRFRVGRRRVDCGRAPHRFGKGENHGLPEQVVKGEFLLRLGTIGLDRPGSERCCRQDGGLPGSPVTRFHIIRRVRLTRWQTDALHQSQGCRPPGKIFFRCRRIIASSAAERSPHPLLPTGSHSASLCVPERRRANRIAQPVAPAVHAPAKTTIRSGQRVNSAGGTGPTWGLE